MKKILKIPILLLITWLIAANFTLKAESKLPTTPMTIEGYVFIRRADGTNITAPAGFGVYAKEGTTVINVEDPQNRWITDASGHYRLGASASQDYVPIDLWVENINVTRIIFHQGDFLTKNLTVLDTTPPTIQIISPPANETLPPNQPAWINATITDDFALDAATILLTLNGTELTSTYNPETGLVYCRTSPLTPGFYYVSLSVKDLAGNPAMEKWSFTVTQRPTVTIISPTKESPVYTQSAKTVQVTYQYTEASPKNATIKIYNSTHTIATATITDLTGGINVQRTDNITIPAGTAEGSYHLNVTIYNIYDLSATATQLGAVKVDNTKPEISSPYQDPPGQVVRPGETVNVEPGYNLTVRVNVTEPNIEKVFLYYNVSATEWMKIQMTPTASGEYKATIPSSSYPPHTTIQYYIEAVDKAGNTAQTPTEGVYFTTYIIPEYQKIILAALLPAIALITALNRKRKRNSS